MSTSAAAQTDHPMDSVWKAALDPTTYVPATLFYDSGMRDWDTSQLLFAQGYKEHNPRYTVDGRVNSTPLSYEAGKQRVVKDTLWTLQASYVVNVTSRLLERALLARYPTHPRLIKALGWVERTTFASWFAYGQSASHYRQSTLNRELARK